MIKPTRITGLERLELLRLRDRVGRLFAALQEATVAEDPLASGAWAPPVDLCEATDALYVRVELPGLRPINSDRLTTLNYESGGRKSERRGATILSLRIFVRSAAMDGSAVLSLCAGRQRPFGDCRVEERSLADSPSQNRRSTRG